MKKSNSFTKIIIGSLLVATGLVVGLTLVFNFLFPKNLLIMQATPILQVIIASTYTPTPVKNATETQAQGAISPNGLTLGDYVQISGTGIDGLRFRKSPTKTSDTLFIAMESEVFKIQNGPQTSDGYTWWFLTAPYDQNRSGWVVADYLTVLSTPNP